MPQQQQPFQMPNPFQQSFNPFQQPQQQSGYMVNGTNPYIQKYCWTHGGCSHTGNECETPAVGHQSNAMFANKIGGSTRNCYV
eukprot:7880540-Ditylum_brightwellii.AAC.1